MTRLPLSALLLLLSGCDSCLPEDLRATKKAGFERMAAARLASCIGYNCTCNAEVTLGCFAAARAYCLDAGYAKTCSQMEPEASCGRLCK